MGANKSCSTGNNNSQGIKPLLYARNLLPASSLIRRFGAIMVTKRTLPPTGSIPQRSTVHGAYPLSCRCTALPEYGGGHNGNAGCFRRIASRSSASAAASCAWSSRAKRCFADAFAVTNDRTADFWPQGNYVLAAESVARYATALRLCATAGCHYRPDAGSFRGRMAHSHAYRSSFRPGNRPVGPA